ncbi:biotin-dependent carboxyltransferase family protein [Dendrosporobacter sp. 1207_IL3150]|uniref:5-oxoprolinase subunit C family protein n=1 Tax=Dendrosporobacter sp. 1207_IL3150 TaxID=3084054 RepID=UPI002FDA1B07
MITTIQQGVFTTIQDEGRWGYQAYGMPIAGAMDRYAYRVSNMLVGNSSNAAVMEMTAVGGVFKFDSDNIAAICGADMQATLNGKPIHNWSSFLVPKNSELKFGQAQAGYRCYFSIRGGIDVPKVLGSRATCSRAVVGGHEGRALRQGDVLRIGRDIFYEVHPHIMDSQYVPLYADQIELRVILGPQENMFSDKAINILFTSSYKITEKSDRLGYSLKGPKVFPIGKADIVSDAMCKGAIQIAANGLPFIMGADHQTTGGFAKIGWVIWGDLPKLGQARPGDVVRFKPVTEDAAVEVLRNEQHCYAKIVEMCNVNRQK